MINDHDPVFTSWLPVRDVSERLPTSGALITVPFNDNDNGVAGSFGSFTVHPVPPAGIYFLLVYLFF